MASAPEADDVASRFGANLRFHRRSAGLTQEDVAFLASVHRTEISLLERGRRTPRIDTLVRVATAVSVSPTDLLDGITWELPTTNEGRIKIVSREDE